MPLAVAIFVYIALSQIKWQTQYNKSFYITTKLFEFDSIFLLSAARTLPLFHSLESNAFDIKEKGMGERGCKKIISAYAADFSV